jgi:hypothetical protein
MSMSPMILRNTPAVRVICTVNYVLAIGLLWFYLPFGIPDRFRIIILPGFIIAGAFGLADIFLTRIVLDGDRLTVVTDAGFRAREIMRGEIELVKWEKGCRAALKLRDGTWFPLPRPGRTDRGCAAAVRGWLRRTREA